LEQGQEVEKNKGALLNLDQLTKVPTQKIKPPKGITNRPVTRINTRASKIRH